MGDEWPKYCRARDLAVEGNRVAVSFTSGRSQKVAVTDEGESIRLSAIVAARATIAKMVEKPANLAILAWQRNRATGLVGFRIDERGRLVGEALVPRVGLTAEEFQIYLRTVASECDRFEFLLTGKDVE
ncbi:hypothetical protein BH09SUM1_BH09SUM1_18860 [soil metagenome]